MSEKPIDCIWLGDETAPRSPSVSMGVDEALTNLVPYPVLRIYRWSIPCISMGYFTPFDSVRAAARSMPIIRRWTGGGVVTHGEDLPFSLVVPRTHPFSTLRPAESYLAIHNALLDALCIQSPLIAHRLTLSRGLNDIRSLSCFDNPVPHDILFDGNKVAGGGQKRTRKAFLHQGSLQISADQHPTPAILASAMSNKVEPFTPDPELLCQAEELARCRYSTLEWTNKF